jgi:hypothetical protein
MVHRDIYLNQLIKLKGAGPVKVVFGIRRCGTKDMYPESKDANVLHLGGFSGFLGWFKLQDKAHFVKFPHFSLGNRSYLEFLGGVFVYHFVNFTFIPHIGLLKYLYQGSVF